MARGRDNSDNRRRPACRLALFLPLFLTPLVNVLLAISVSAMLFTQFPRASLAAEASTSPAASAPTSAIAAAATQPTAKAAYTWRDRLRLFAEDNETLIDAAYDTLVEGLADFRSDQAKQVTVERLLDAPDTYRGQPIRMTVRFRSVELKDRRDGAGQVYGIRAYVGEPRTAKPVFILSPNPPPKFSSNEQFEVFGYFDKILVRFTRDETKDPVDVPVIVADHLVPQGAKLEPGGGFAIFATFAGLMLGLVIVWMLLRTWLGRKARGRASAAAGPAYRPLRYEMTAEDNERTKVVIPEQDPPLPPGSLPTKDQTPPTNTTTPLR